LAYRGIIFWFSPHRTNVGQTSGDNRLFLQFMLYGPRCANVGQTSGNNWISLQMSDYSDVKSEASAKQAALTFLTCNESASSSFKTESVH
jgi:hypothetical protein